MTLIALAYRGHGSFEEIYVTKGAAGDSKGGMLVDFMNMEYALVPKTEETVAAYNQLKLCGIDHWKLNTETKVPSSAGCFYYTNHRRLVLDATGNLLKFYGDPDSSTYMELKAN